MLVTPPATALALHKNGCWMQFVVAMTPFASLLAVFEDIASDHAADSSRATSEKPSTSAADLNFTDTALSMSKTRE